MNRFRALSLGLVGMIWLTAPAGASEPELQKQQVPVTPSRESRQQEQLQREKRPASPRTAPAPTLEQRGAEPAAEPSRQLMQQQPDPAAHKAKIERQRRQFAAAAAAAQRELEKRKLAAEKEQATRLKREVSLAQAEMDKLRASAARAQADQGPQIEPAIVKQEPPRITGGLGALQGGNPLIVGGTSFGSQPGKVHLLASGGSLELAIDEWHPGGIGGRVPALADRLCLTGEVQVEREDGKRSNTWIFSVPVIYESLPSRDAHVVHCGDDGNMNLCNKHEHFSAGPACWSPQGGVFTRITYPGATVSGFHVNCWGAIGDDSGVDTYEIGLYGGWVLDSAGFVSHVPAGEGWTQPSSGVLPAGFQDGATSWRPEIAWSVTPNDEVAYALYVLIRGPECTSHR